MPAYYVLHQRPGFVARFFPSQSGTWAPKVSVRKKLAPKGKGKASLNQQLKQIILCMMCFSPWVNINKCCWHLLIIFFLPVRTFFWEYWNHQNTSKHQDCQLWQYKNNATIATGIFLDIWLKIVYLYSMYAIVIRFLQVLHFLQSINWVQHTLSILEAQKFHFFSILCRKTG